MNKKNSEIVTALTVKIEQTFPLKLKEKMQKKRSQLAQHLSKMTTIACTVASEPLARAVLGGYSLQINMGTLKPLKAVAEGYCLDERSCHPLSPVFYALSHLYSLRLSHLPITLHLTCAKTLEYLQTLPAKDDPISKGVSLLLKNFPETNFVPCFQGFFFEKMHSRLRQLRCEEINEVIALDFTFLSTRLLEE